MQRFLTRQPLLDAEHRVVGYELKRRDRTPVEVIPGAESAQQALDESLLVSVIDLDFKHALGDRLTFLGVSADTLHNPLVEQLPKRNVALALQPDCPPDSALLERALELSRAGTLLALDDPDADNPLLPLCRYARLDATRYDAATLATQAASLHEAAGSELELIATRVDTPEVDEACRRLSFKLVQGYYYTQLNPASPQRVGAGIARVVELLNMVMEEADIPLLEDKIKLDPGLSYKLLRYINSPAIGLRQPVQSLGHAVALLGHNQLYRWLTLLLFTGGETTPRNQTLLRNALVRGHFTEHLGWERFPPTERGGLFISGIFSLLGALLNQPMDQALAPINLLGNVQDALLRDQGPYAPYLNLAIACERFDQETITRRAGEVDLDADAVNLAHVNALIWSEGVDI